MDSRRLFIVRRFYVCEIGHFGPRGGGTRPPTIVPPPDVSRAKQRRKELSNLKEGHFLRQILIFGTNYYEINLLIILLVRDIIFGTNAF